MANLQKLLFAENIAIFISINIFCNCNVVADSLIHIYIYIAHKQAQQKNIISNQAKHLIIYHTSFIFQDWTGWTRRNHYRIGSNESHDLMELLFLVELRYNENTCTYFYTTSQTTTYHAQLLDFLALPLCCAATDDDVNAIFVA